jgi:hypothetical protein
MYKFLLRKKIKNILNHSDRQKVYHNLKEIKTILILFDTRDYADISLFIKDLQKKEKKVKALAYKDKSDTADYSKSAFGIVTSKEMKNLKGDALIQISNSFGELVFDLVVDMTQKENLLLQYILVDVQSPFKVGFYKTDPPIHDMVISLAPEPESDSVSTIKELGKQLIYYLTIISSESK